ncbi:Maf family protein [Streptococcus suis]|uniref:Maf family protein n=1 Tax=Streptococcus suis TaxID=1307 RepID=UPI001ABEC262|nr:Maf family protein [Streptococcus suis]
MKYIVDYEKDGTKPLIEKVVLLSTSPRRKQLLEFLKPEIAAVEVDERGIEELFMERFAADDFLTRAAKTCCEISKAKSDCDLEEGVLYISADTIVVFEDQVYNKPGDETEARAMLLSYFGKKHEVVTSVCLRAKNYLEVFYTVAEIEFVDWYPDLQEAVDSYLASGSPMDKAGAYGFQELDPRFISHVAGDIHTIIGLPVAETARRIAERQ